MELTTLRLNMAAMLFSICFLRRLSENKRKGKVKEMNGFLIDHNFVCALSWRRSRLETISAVSCLLGYKRFYRFFSILSSFCDCLLPPPFLSSAVVGARLGDALDKISSQSRKDWTRDRKTRRGHQQSTSSKPSIATLQLLTSRFHDRLRDQSYWIQKKPSDG